MTASDSPQGSHPCPSREELAAFHAGRLPAPALEAIAVHLEACECCSSALVELSAGDDLCLAELRQPVQPDVFAAEAAQVLGRIEKLDFGQVARAGSPLQLSSEPGQSGRSNVSSGGRLGQYELLEKLGEGGMGEVFKARHVLMDRVVALKVIHSRHLGQSEAILRFQREIRALARMEHPHIVCAQYADQVGETHFLVMEYVEGTDLGRLVAERGPVPVAQACEVIRQAAMGLQHAHEHGLVHRDLKPSNLILSRPGPQGIGLGVVKILDLGIARFRGDRPADGNVTPTGEVMGTVDYLAPEQLEDSRAVDIRADLYSLGCTLYHLLAGRPPFSGPEYSSAYLKMKAHAEAPVPPVQEIRPEVPDGLAAVLERLLAKKPAHRYATPAEVAADLQPFAASADLPASGGLDARRPGRPDEAGGSRKDARQDRRPVRRHLALALAVAVLAVVLLVAVGWQLGLRFGKPSAPEDAVRPDPGPSATPGDVPGQEELRIVSLRIRHYRGSPARPVGEIGVNSFATHVQDDDVRVHAKFSRPAYCFLIAFNPNGKEQLCSPAEETAVPPPAEELTFPAEKDVYFGLTEKDGAGLQAFVLVASREPLPSYQQWQGRVGAAPWKAIQDDWVWRFDGQQLDPLGTERGQPRKRGGPPEALEELCNFFKDRTGIKAIQVLAFPVKK